MKMKILAILFSVILIAISVAASAEQKLGVNVYPGASFDVSVTKIVKQMGSDAACYRTSDELVKVIEFYKNQPGLKVLNTNKEGGMFRKGQDIDITIQRPWMDMNTGKMMNDTLISIVKQK
jgi:hypothetical protein